MNEADETRLRTLLQRYLVVRGLRIHDLADVEARERLMERREGSAHLVGCQAAAVLTKAPANGLVDCIRQELEKPLTAFSAMPESDAVLMRWRLYGTGAAISFLLDRLHLDWRKAVEDNGEAGPYQLLTEALRSRMHPVLARAHQ